jgi:hypothetical protein
VQLPRWSLEAPIPAPTGGSVDATATSVSLGGSRAATTSNSCFMGITDQSNPAVCLAASSVPVLGMLLPLSADFNLTPAGDVGVGTTTPSERLDVAGKVRATQLVSTTSGAPLQVASTVKVPSLNADLLDGLDSTAFSQLGNSIEGSEITDGTVTNADIADATILFADIAPTGAASGQIVKWSGAAWIASADLNSGGTVTSVATGSGLAGGPITGSGTISVPTGGITSAHILDATVLSADLASNAVTSAKIAADAVTGAKVLNGSLGTADLADSAVATSKIADAAVTVQKLGSAGALPGQFVRTDGTDVQ